MTNTEPPSRVDRASDAEPCADRARTATPDLGQRLSDGATIAADIAREQVEKLRAKVQDYSQKIKDFARRNLSFRTHVTATRARASAIGERAAFQLTQRTTTP